MMEYFKINSQQELEYFIRKKFLVLLFELFNKVILYRNDNYLKLNLDNLTINNIYPSLFFNFDYNKIEFPLSSQYILENIKFYFPDNNGNNKQIFTGEINTSDICLVHLLEKHIEYIKKIKIENKKLYNHEYRNKISYVAFNIRTILTHSHH